MAKKQVEFVTQTEFAKKVGVSQARISKLFIDGKLKGATKVEGRKVFIDVGKGIALLKEALDPSQHGKIRVAIGEPAPEKPVQRRAEESGERTGGVKPVIDFSQARTLNEQYKAAIRKLEYEEKIGKLVDAARVKEAAFNMGRRIRDAMLNIPDRVSAILAAENDEGKIRETLNREIKIALEELSKDNV